MPNKCSLPFFSTSFRITLTQIYTTGGWVHPGDFASAGWCQKFNSLKKKLPLFYVDALIIKETIERFVEILNKFWDPILL